ncbi:hypothetical protein [Mycolicibacterium parafortuitum]|nr:hypothetical protein [Mycolicibacterium parafortuitum]
MNASVRAVLAAGVVAVTGGAVAFSPPIHSLSERVSAVVAPITYTAGSTRILPIADREVLAALINPTLLTGEGASSPFLPALVPNLALADEPAPDGAEDEVAVQNAASDVIESVYRFTRYWANYVSLDLGPWLINWIPFGYLISNQIQIWYPRFVLPVVDSFVYDFLVPVVNDPLNLAVWAQGIGDMINTAVTGVRDGITEEIRYIVTLGWLPFPLPPLPPFPIPGGSLATVSADAGVQLATLDGGDAAVEDTGAEDAGDAAAPADVDAAEPVSQKPTVVREDVATEVEDEVSGEVSEGTAEEDVADDVAEEDAAEEDVAEEDVVDEVEQADEAADESQDDAADEDDTAASDTAGADADGDSGTGTTAGDE